MQTVLERFLRYVQINTESADDMEMVPSTECQWELAKLLVDELNEIGASNVRLADNCYVYAEIPATTDRKLPTLGFIAHMDTSNAVTGKGVKPQIIKAYDGGKITLNKELNITMDATQYPELLHFKGEDLIVTDGQTLLGADDKAGIAEIMAMAEYYLTHPEIEHGIIKIGFTPDEEVGRGVDFFDVEGFKADYAYTIDGGELGEIEYENFNAAAVKIDVQGNSVHPGTAKGKMKNALLLAMEFQGMLPKAEAPEYTEGYEGFYLLTNMEGSVEQAVMHYILRDHDAAKLEDKKQFVLRMTEYLNKVYGADTFKVNIKDSYRNMREQIEKHMHLIRNAENAMKRLGIEPKIMPIRGGTDGARLSYMGLPCPNLCTGGANFHGRYEYISIQAMEKVVKLICEIIENYEL